MRAEIDPRKDSRILLKKTSEYWLGCRANFVAHIGFEVITAVIMKSSIFWDIMQYIFRA
jgi:hypothetical protein